ncbi:DUF1761 domain-containing protein [uncultured Jannaschia sp.]|uniref:DUF1761 domain-containing protein n=1 Tax=uncultured Jannaschia sp. TaxID=293347 RepID=UPI0026377107|nr:DUF1761 domain-containing protein [uncultured Jannaschia sp.]
MTILSIIAAAVAAWVFGAVWYGIIGKGWMAASGLTEETVNRKDPVPYVGSFLCTVVVAATLAYVLGLTGIADPSGGLMLGLGLGLFAVAPWVATNVLFSQRPRGLIWMDGVYPTVGMALMGLVLGLF